MGEAYNGHRDGQDWVVPASLSKNGNEHRVFPLLPRHWLRVPAQLDLIDFLAPFESERAEMDGDDSDRESDADDEP